MGGTGETGRGAVACLVVLALGACTGSGSDQVTAVGSTATASAEASRGAPLQERPAVQGPNDEDQDHQEPEAVPTWDQAARADALEVARRTMQAFGRPTLDEATWWKELAPLLTTAAVVAYTGTDPAEVPVNTISGEPVLAEDSSAYLARVAVPTDAGTYTVLLVREGAGQPWLAERITPAESGQP